MRSREGSDAGSELRDFRSPSSSQRSYSVDDKRITSQRRRQLSDSPMSNRDFEGYSMASSQRSMSQRPSSAPSATGGRRDQNLLVDTDLKKIVLHIGHHCLDEHGDLKQALKDVRVDRDGNMTRGDVRRFFEEHHVPTRMADRFFDHVNRERRGSLLHMDELVNIFEREVGDHLCKGVGSKKNVHGLLRPPDTELHICDLAKTAEAKVMQDPTAMSNDRKKLIQKLMCSKEQRRYIDKYGNMRREDMQLLFNTYGLPSCKGNELFDRIDSDRTGEISFKDLQRNIGEYLGIKDKEKRTHVGREKKEIFDDDTMVRVCDHIGTKVSQKHRRVQDAFRFIDTDADDCIDRWECRTFFRNYGSKTKVADIFFDSCDPNRTGKVLKRDFQRKFTPYIQPGYHPPRPNECQKAFYEEVKTTKWCRKDENKTGDAKNRATRPLGLNTLMLQASKQKAAGQPTSPTPSEGRRSQVSHNGSIPESQMENELHANRFGKFEGVSTYMASFNQDIYHAADLNL